MPIHTHLLLYKYNTIMKVTRLLLILQLEQITHMIDNMIVYYFVRSNNKVEI